MAYQELDKFNNYGKIDVQKTLETLVTKMNSFYTEVKSTAGQAERLASALERANDAREAKKSSSGTFDAGGSGGYSKYHDGGIAGESSSQKHTGKLKSNEVVAVLEKGEPILSNKKSASDVKNALDYLEEALPVNNTAAMLAAFVNDAISIQDMVNKPMAASLNSSVVANSMLSRNLIPSPIDSKIERINTSPSSEAYIDNRVTIQGNVDKDTLPKLETILKKAHEYTVKEIGYRQFIRGQGSPMKSY